VLNVAEVVGWHGIGVVIDVEIGNLMDGQWDNVVAMALVEEWKWAQRLTSV
jgi:hypothetical protein